MKPVVISPPGDELRELAVLGALFAAGLERYHVRKPGWTAGQLHQWLADWPETWRRRVVLHLHHELVARLGLGGRHWPDDGTSPGQPETDGFASRSCHNLKSLCEAAGRYDAVFFSPVFPSLSKPGHGPVPAAELSKVTAWLAARGTAARRPRVLALGGVTAVTAPQALALGFDAVAVLGTIWQAADPVQAYIQLSTLPARHAA
jgi:thiamine-phosphate pyrophosphorylase